MHEPSPPARLLDAILDRNDLEKPDGRPLRAYGITDAEYAAMREIVLDSGWGMEHGHSQVTALFGLAVAEWFRREATTTRREWADCGLVPRALDDDPNLRTEVVARCLRWWGIGLERSRGGGREPLLSLALQGGIPAHILRDGPTSSLARYVRAVMAQAWAQWPCDRGRIADGAAAGQDMLILTLRGPVIAEQTVDTVLALCRLRERLPGGLARGDTVSWLDANEADWRGTIPLHLPGDGATLDVLFCDMLLEPPARLAPSARIARILIREGAAWRTGIVLPANGDMPARTFDLKAHGEGRFGVTLMDEAGVAFPGMPGHLYWRPGDGDRDAHLNCDLGRNAGVDVAGVRLSTPVEIRLTRTDVAPFAAVWPGGEAVRSDVVAFRAVAEDRYAMAGSGSVRGAEDHLLVMADESAVVTATEGGTVERIGTVNEDGLWRVEGGATVHKGKARYRIACGAEAPERVLTVPEAWTPTLRFENRALTPVWKGERPGRSHGSGRLRLAGCRAACGTGRGAFVWLDDEGFTVDRRGILVLPQTFAIGASEGQGGGASVTWSGLPGWTVRVDGQGARAGEGGEAVVEAGARMRVPVTLIDPEGRHTRCTVDPVVRRAHLVDREGRTAAPRERIALTDMRDWMLRLPRPGQVDLILMGTGAKPLTVGLRKEGDVPLQEVHGAAEWMLALSGNQDARVDVAVDGGTMCSLARTRLRLQTLGNIVSLADGAEDRDAFRAVMRPIAEHAREHDLHRTEPGAWALPPPERGPGIVYLRTARGVLTRPLLARGLGPDRADDPFAEALAITGYDERQARLAALLDAAPENPGTLKSLREIVVSLDGLSPLSLDVLGLLGERPDALAALLISATDGERADVLALERGLPFLWMSLPVTAWQRATDGQMDMTAATLRDAGIDAPEAAARNIVTKLNRIGEETAWFAAVQGLFGGAPGPATSLGDIVQTHVRGFGGRANGPPSLAPVLERCRVGVPPEIGAVNWREHTALLAPVVLGLRVRRAVELSPDERWNLRHALIFDRDYVTDAFPHCLEACAP